MVLYAFLLFFVLLGVSALKDFNITVCNAIEIVSREEWRARPATRRRPMNLPVNHVVILHTATAFCMTKRQCIRNIQFAQDFHMNERGWWDISYSFLIGGDGRIYEGRGWGEKGGVNYLSNSLGLAFIGNFNIEVPTQTMIEAAFNFINCCVQKGYVTPSHEIHGHRDCDCTESPGKNLYAVIRQWSNYKGGRLSQYHCMHLPYPEMNVDVIYVH